MIKIYYAPRTRSFTALWAIEESGAPYEKVLTDISTGAQKQDGAYLAINPMGKVPALQDGDAGMGEAAGICAYIAEKFPEAKLAPPLGDPRRVRYLYWLFFAANIEAAITQIATKIEMPQVSAGWGSATQVFDVIDKALEKGPWILGDQFTAADIPLGAGLNFGVKMFGMVPMRPNFERYIDRCTARPAFQRATALSS